MSKLLVTILIASAFLAIGAWAPADSCVRPEQASHAAAQVVAQWLRFDIGTPTSRVIDQQERAALRGRIKSAILVLDGCQ